jgi:DNA-binding NarL/FixJ family response regulator
LSEPAPVIRVLVVEGLRLVARGLQLLLTAEPDLEVVGPATTSAEAIELALEVNPDVVLIDYWLEGATGTEVARAIRAETPDAKAVFLGTTISPVFVMKAVRAGARAYLLKSQAGSELVEAIRRVARGEMLIPATILVAVLREETQRGPLDDLTPRERDLLRLLAQGLDNRTIAERLGIRYVTVRGHLRNLLNKLNAHSRLQAVARATELGLIER